MTPGNAALLTDLYELRMAQAYLAEQMTGPAVFTLSCRTLPPQRNYAIACGLDDVLHFIESLRVDGAALDYLRTVGGFTEDFLRWLGTLHFTGDVFALPEGTPVFPGEPILEVVAPLPQAQLLETLVMNQVHVQTVLASKAARLVTAAAGAPVIDFGLRRTHGTDAGMKAARASYAVGFAGTSNVLAGQVYGLPVIGTMAHSYVQAHDHEIDAFRAFARQYPDATLLVDTYDTLRGVDHVIALARELGPAFRIRQVRLDSGDLAALAAAARQKLDAAGLSQVGIVASGGLDEHRIADLVARRAPIDAFAVGSELAVSQDAPLLDLVYKLAEYAGVGRIKTSPGKLTLPGRKQVYRTERDGVLAADVIGRADEAVEGRPLLRPVMRGGERLPEGREPLSAVRARARAALAQLPPTLTALAPAPAPYPVTLSPGLAHARDEVRARALAEN